MMSALTQRTQTRAWAIIAAALFVLVVTLASSPALAHSELESSTPAAGASVSSLTQIELVYGEAITPEFSTFALTDSMGMKVGLGAPTYDVTKTHVTVPLAQSLMAGKYSFGYSVLSVDGHTVAGSFSFTSTSGSSASSSTNVPTASPSDNNASGGGSNSALTYAIIGAVAGAVVVAVISWVMRRNAKKAEQSEPTDSSKPKK